MRAAPVNTRSCCSTSLYRDRVQITGFPANTHWVAAENTQPLCRWRYIRIVDVKGVPYWLNKNSLLKRFSVDARSRRVLVHHFPQLSKPTDLVKLPPQMAWLQEALPPYTSETFTNREIQAIFGAVAETQLNSSYQLVQPKLDGSPRPIVIFPRHGYLLLTHLQEDKTLGLGHQSRLFYAINLSDQSISALKFDCSSEISILESLRDKHGIIRMEEVFVNERGEKCALLEYCSGGSLDSMPRNDNPLEDLCDIAIGLHHIHEAGVIHGNITLQNTLKDDQGLKICDFGMSLQYPDKTNPRFAFYKAEDIASLGNIFASICDIADLPLLELLIQKMRDAKTNGIDTKDVLRTLYQIMQSKGDMVSLALEACISRLV